MNEMRQVTIEAARPLLTLVNVYEVEPARQAELVEALTASTENVMRPMPGFLSVSIHASLDGTKVVNYAQWASKEDFELMIRHPAAQTAMREFAGLAKTVSPSLYRVSAVVSG